MPNFIFIWFTATARYRIKYAVRAVLCFIVVFYCFSETSALERKHAGFNEQSGSGVYLNSIPDTFNVLAYGNKQFHRDIIELFGSIPVFSEVVGDDSAYSSASNSPKRETPKLNWHSFLLGFVLSLFGGLLGALIVNLLERNGA